MFCIPFRIVGLLASAIMVLTACGGGGSFSGGGIVATGKAEINGNVSDSWQSSQLGNIQVSVDQQRTHTDARGRFSLKNIDPGSKQVRFSRGTNSAALRVDATANSRVTLKDVRLKNHSATPESVSHTSTSDSDDKGRNEDRDGSGEDRNNDRDDNDDDSDDDHDDDRDDDKDSDSGDEQSDNQDDSSDDDQDSDEDDNDDDKNESDDDDCDKSKSDCQDDD